MRGRSCSGRVEARIPEKRSGSGYHACLGVTLTAPGFPFPPRMAQALASPAAKHPEKNGFLRGSPEHKGWLDEEKFRGGSSPLHLRGAHANYLSDSKYIHREGLLRDIQAIAVLRRSGSNRRRNSLCLCKLSYAKVVCRLQIHP